MNIAMGPGDEDEDDDEDLDATGLWQAPSLSSLHAGEVDGAASEAVNADE